MTKHREVAKALETILKDNATTIGLKSVFYGDTTLKPEMPSVEVLTSTKNRRIRSTGRFDLTFETFLLLEYGKVQSREDTRDELETFAENMESFLHQHHTLGGLVIDSWVSTMQFGVALRNDAMYQSARLTHIAIGLEVR